MDEEMILRRLFKKRFHKHQYNYDSDFVIDKDSGLKEIVYCNICDEPRNPKIVTQILWDNYFIDNAKMDKHFIESRAKMTKAIMELKFKPIEE